VNDTIENIYRLILFLVLSSVVSINMLASQYVPLASGFKEENVGFRKVAPKDSGVLFSNEVTLASAARNQVLLNGSGVAAGDFDRDGLVDLFFCGLQTNSTLYKNLGDLHFKAIHPKGLTALRGIPCTTCAFIDLNNDSYLDLLVGTMGSSLSIFLNNTMGDFTRQTVELPEFESLAIYGTPITDIDEDGDLDIYVSTYRSSSISNRDKSNLRFVMNFENGKQIIKSIIDVKTKDEYNKNRFYIHNGQVLESGTPDYLLLNNGLGGFEITSIGDYSSQSNSNQRFGELNWGLGAIFGDINNDFRDDLYVCNDLNGADYIYYGSNNGFKNAASKLNYKTPVFSMGVDIADINNDGFSDFIVVDMLNYRLAERKMQIPFSSSLYNTDNDGGSMLARGEQTAQSTQRLSKEYRRNMLYLGNCEGIFDEIANYSGLESSNWSWCPIFLDVDLDGYEDLLVTNGFSYDAENPDAQHKLKNNTMNSGVRGNIQADSFQIKYSKIDQNICFRNNGDLTFKDKSRDWGFDLKGISHGACVADLDNDGDQDVILNNFSLYLPKKQVTKENASKIFQSNPLCTIYENLSNADRIKVQVRLNDNNTHGVGASISFTQDSTTKRKQIRAGSRYCSSDSPELTFPYKQGGKVNLLECRLGKKIWKISNVQPNNLYIFDDDDLYINVAPAINNNFTSTTSHFQKQVTRQKFRHSPNEFSAEYLQPGIIRNMFIIEPAVSTFNGATEKNTLVKISNGSSVKNIPLQKNVKITNRNNSNSSWNLIDFVHIQHKHEINRLELYSRFNAQLTVESKLVLAANSKNVYSIIREYLFDTNLTCLTITRHPTRENFLIVALGGGTKIRHYPLGEKTVLMELNLDKPSDEPTILLMPLFNHPVNDMVFSDLDGSKGQELAIAPEGGKIHVFQITEQGAVNITSTLGLDSGVSNWNSIACFDFNGDGTNDLLAGNWGCNNPLNRYYQENYKLFYKKIGDIVRLYETFELNNRNIFKSGLSLFQKYNPIRGASYVDHQSFQFQGIENIFEESINFINYDNQHTRLFTNVSDGFKQFELPKEVQFSPTFGIAVEDFNLDGSVDIALCQGFNRSYGNTEQQLNNSHLILLNNITTSGDFKVTRGTGIARNNSFSRVIGSGDFNSDNKPDIFFPKYAGDVNYYANTTIRSDGIKLQLNGNTLDLIGLKARLRYRDGSKGPLYEYTPKYGYRKEAPNYFIFGSDSLAVAIEIINGAKHIELDILPRIRTYQFH